MKMILAATTVVSTEQMEMQMWKRKITNTVAVDTVTEIRLDSAGVGRSGNIGTGQQQDGGGSHCQGRGQGSDES